MTDIEDIRRDFQDWRYAEYQPMTELEAAFKFIHEMGLTIQPSDLLENND